MNIKEIAELINSLSVDYKIGNLQNIRKELRGLSKIPSKSIFDYRTIFDYYAFHIGGRSEFQFNIGYEKELSIFRFGLAFSLEQSQTLPNIEVLFPRIDRFNLYLKSKHFILSEMQMWHYNNNIRSKNYNVNKITSELKKNHTFIFIGKYFPKKIHEITNEDCRNILETFDDLLDLYIFVENEKGKKNLKDYSGKFVFKPGMNDFQKQYFVNQVPSNRTVNATHKSIQENIYNNLIKQYGELNVGVEHSSGYGTHIDLVVKDKSNYIFYEIKTSKSILKCIREALPQLLEYAYYPNRNVASKLIIVSENEITIDTKKYLNKLRKEFSIPVYYQRYNPSNKNLENELY
ncbi:hypothetical protein [Ignavibacterium sp.]|uniref:hypothetical protein n=1 Tax=Ignavibacterium sp. TaxID=2651167 RepID=UPI0021F98EB2|nr:hypothetical protein [Ignavibacterium sp.]BDQ03428.1 MAG: hypothetical protein KatS3mg037_2003 [Ignavibacterium sp.]